VINEMTERNCRMGGAVSAGESVRSITCRG
jgi:hypothetical protein